jgi:type III pantothenate kinase
MSADMLLAIDSGNTNTVFAVFDGEGKIRGEWRSSTDTERTADEFGMWLTQLMEMQGVQPADIKASILATVVPATLFGLKTLSRKYFGCDPLVVGKKASISALACWWTVPTRWAPTGWSTRWPPRKPTAAR